MDTLGRFSASLKAKKAVEYLENGEEAKAKELLSELDNSNKSKTTLNDLGEDWVVNAVSLVDEPAVPAAKFTTIKSRRGNDTKVYDRGERDAEGKRIPKSKRFIEERDAFGLKK